MAASLEELIFLNEENQTIKIMVNAEIAAKARSDIIFAQSLYENSNQLQEELVDDPEEVNDFQSTENTSIDHHIWSDNETKLLLATYKDNKDKKISVKCLLKRISENMKEQGYNIAPEKCNTKLQALKRSFKKVKDHNKRSGNEKKTCKHYEMLQDIFEKEPWIQPVAVAGTSIEPDKENEEPPRKKNKKDVLQLLLEEKRLNRQDANRRHEEKMNRIDVMHQLLQNLSKE